MPDPAERGRTGFVPVVLLGLGSSAMAAIASAKSWYGAGSAATGGVSVEGIDQGASYPLASAVSLVLLAAWGVLLVTRGVVRRAFAVLCVVASLALVASVVAGYATLPDTSGDSLATALGRNRDPGFTAWFWTAAAAAVLSLAPGVLAVRLAPRWPEMGARYDAPAQREDAAAQEAVDPDRDLWRALDEGRDPTRET